MCCIIVCSSVIVPQHFTKYMASATSIAISGIDIGGFLSPIIMEQLLTIFRWNTVFLLLGCFIAISSIAAITFKPVDYSKENEKSESKSSVDFKESYCANDRKMSVIDTSIFKSPPIVILYVSAIILHFLGRCFMLNVYPR